MTDQLEDVARFIITSALSSNGCLITKFDNQNEADGAMARLEIISKSLKKHNVDLEIKLHRDLHDRQVRLNSGWTIKIGRGLDIYHPKKLFSSSCRSDQSPFRVRGIHRGDLTSFEGNRQVCLDRAKNTGVP
jgi:hypothetical protein